MEDQIHLFSQSRLASPWTYLCSALLAVFFLAGCDSDSNKASKTTYEGGETVFASSANEFFHTYIVSDDDGIHASGLNVEVEGGEIDIVKTEPSFYFVQVDVSYTPVSHQDSRILHFSGKDATGAPLDPFTSNIIPSCGGGRDTDVATVLEGEDTVVALSTELLVHDFVVRDDDCIAAHDLVVTVEGGDADIAKTQLSPVEVLVSITYRPTSRADDRTIRFSGVDGTGSSLTPLTAVIDSQDGTESLPRYELDILVRDFEDKQMTTGDLLHLSHLDSSTRFDTTLISDGRFRAQLPEGDYSVVLEPSPEKSRLGRVFVTPEHLDDPVHHFIESGRMVDRDGAEVETSNYSYLVFGADAFPANLTLQSDFVSFAEVMSDANFVDRMKTQLSNPATAYQFGPAPEHSLVHMRVKNHIVFATMDGEGIRPATYPPYTGSCQGLPVSDQALEYHRLFFEHSLALLNSIEVGGNPYNSIERRVFDPFTVGLEVPCPNWNIRYPLRYPEEGIAFHLLDDAVDSLRSEDPYKAFFLFVEKAAGAAPQGSSAYTIRSAKVSSKTGQIGHIANQSRSIWALDRETQDATPNGSVRDGEVSGWLPDKPPIPTDVVQYEFDDRFVKVATAFGPWAQYQLNPVNGRRGKNVRLSK